MAGHGAEVADALVEDEHQALGTVRCSWFGVDVNATEIHERTPMLLAPSTRIRMAECADDPTLHLARQELAGFLRRSPGVTVAAEGKIEACLEVEPRLPGYRLSVEDGRLVFAGRRAVDVLYCVYHFAEQDLGFCFFEPGIDRVNVKSQVHLPEGQLIDQRAPLLKNRGLVQEFPPAEDAMRLADWMARNRLNYLLIWMKYYDLFSPRLKEYYRVRGIRIEAGHHNFDYYIPAARYYAQHPAFFAVRDGQRVAPAPDDTPFLHSRQLCVTNQDLRAQVVDNMVHYLKKHPELDVLSLVPNDGFGWCECACCASHYDRRQRGDVFTIAAHVYPAQELYHDLVRDIASRLRARLPHVQLTLVAYVNYVEPARDFVLGDNLAVHFAPYWRCINHHLHDTSCPINHRYMQALDHWKAAKQGGMINLYEYYMGVNLYVSLPMVHHARLFEELPALARRGVDGVLTQFHLAHWTAYGLNYYCMAKAAYGDSQAAVERVFSNLFGSERQEAEQLFTDLRKVQDSAGPCLLPVPRLLLNHTDAVAYMHLVARAQQLADKAPADAFRQSLAVWMRYLLRLKQLFDRYRAGEDVRPDLDEFVQWAEQRTQKHHICVADRLRKLINAWKEAIEQGRPWIHFNIDWEDRYVRAYDRVANDPSRWAGDPPLMDGDANVQEQVREGAPP